MRKILLLSLLVMTYGAEAQVVSTFETLSLSTADTYYVNYNNPAVDVGFEDGLAYFPCVYDTVWGGLWSSGFAYSNMTDTVTAAYTNMYSARPGKGANNSDQYVVAWQERNVVHLRGAAAGRPVPGCYLTNSTYAYLSMRDGDDFTPPFSGANNDWFKLTIQGYSGGQLTPDSVEFYLADFRSSDSTEHFVLGTWEWVDLSSLGNVDSLQFLLSTSNMMKPSYFCMDDFMAERPAPGFVATTVAAGAKIYPNPTSGTLYIDYGGQDIRSIRLFDLTGKLLSYYDVAGAVAEINTSNLATGTYILTLHNSQGAGSAIRFQKQ